MHQFVFQQGLSGALRPFPHILEIGVKKIQSIQLNSFPENRADCFRIFHVIEGKFEWSINNKVYMLFPGDTAIISTGTLFGNSKNILEIGSIAWIHIKLGHSGDKLFAAGSNSGLNTGEQQTILKVLLMNSMPVVSKLNETARILQAISYELQHQEIGYLTRVSQLTDEMFITLTRYLSHQKDPVRNFPQVFMQLEQELRRDLSHQWTVEEMAAIVGMGSTMFNERVKTFTGFTPLNYLINIRISEAMKMLKKSNINITDIALDTGFYSSQHFSTTFKKLTGYTPREFRKNYLIADKD
jgi:AraC-like DNA-binding protein